MNANSNINNYFIRGSTEDVQSSVEEVASTRGIEVNQQTKIKLILVIVTRNIFYQILNGQVTWNEKKKDTTLSIAPKMVGNKREPTYQQN